MIRVQKDQAAALPIVLRDSTNYAEAETGVVHGDVTIKFRKWNDTSWTDAVVDASNWTEVGNGHYTWDATAGNLDTEGAFLYAVQASGCVQYEGAVDVSTTVSGGHVEFE